MENDREPRWGDRLMQAHDVLRQQVAAARAALPAGAGLSEQLRTHCETVCVYLHGHHTSEDGGFFPHVETKFPGLEEAIARLRREHVVVDRVLSELKAVNDGEDPEQARVQLDQLASMLEAHFA
ncbi:hemerythrin domain-containing protein [Pseudonocardia nigra]|uniref:hemerythrin domain-containing protein n=1 Tax=Pseudonocardia nigra TaxID=1921578 RepID=UPI001C5CFABF|nr:hemerythrin domain-containing protein [Pseudonocardia nigra]